MDVELDEELLESLESDGAAPVASDGAPLGMVHTIGFVAALCAVAQALSFVVLTGDPAQTVVLVMVLIGAWMSMGGGVGVAASLYAAKVLNPTHVTILLPAIFLMGAQIQYMGRLLGTAGIQGRYYPMLFGISILNAVISMIIMRFFA